ncbi:hypothetical protein FOL47_006133 [Perkinsus chesapeaki]|uniref:Uncharacterized protein n=1 Tax=Perkinsus chesapeaki TaxID=330153 RepID=A0A7J6MY05_PERCH|nr:hypothetical protein FOL47_006133 [Perkinsus chesapeaki]
MPALLARIAATITPPKVNDDEAAQTSGIVLKLGATTSRPKIRAFRLESSGGSSYLVYRSHRLFSSSSEVKLPLPKFKLYDPRPATAHETKCVVGSDVCRKIYGTAAIEASRCFDADLLIGSKPRRITVFAVPDSSLMALYRCLLALRDARGVDDGGDLAAAFGGLISPVNSAFAPSLFSSAPDSARSWRSNASSMVPPPPQNDEANFAIADVAIPKEEGSRGKSESTEDVDTPEVEAALVEAAIAASLQDKASPSVETTPASTVIAWHAQGPTVELNAAAGSEDKAADSTPEEGDEVVETNVQDLEAVGERKRSSPCTDMAKSKRRRLDNDDAAGIVEVEVEEEASPNQLAAVVPGEDEPLSPVLPCRGEVEADFNGELQDDDESSEICENAAQAAPFKIRLPSSQQVLSNDSEIDDFLTVKRFTLLLLFTYIFGVVGAGSMLCNGVFSLLVAIGSLFIVIHQRRTRRSQMLELVPHVEGDESRNDDDKVAVGS